jgi:hypothetical protein
MSDKQANMGGLIGGTVGAVGTGLLAHKLIKPRHMPALAGAMRDPDSGRTETTGVTPEQMARVLQVLTAIGGGAIGAGLGHGMQKIVTAGDKQAGFMGGAIGGLGGLAAGNALANRIPASSLPYIGGGEMRIGNMGTGPTMTPEQVKAILGVLLTAGGGLAGAGLGSDFQNTFLPGQKEEEPKLAGVLWPEKEDIPTIARYGAGGLAMGGSAAALLSLIHDIRLQRQLGREQQKLQNPETDENTIVLNLPPKAAEEKQANDPPTFALSMLAAIGGGTAGYSLVRKLYQQQLLKEIKRKEEAARTAVMNEMMPKAGQAEPFSWADIPMGTAYLLAALGAGGSAYVTKKILDERFRTSDREKYEPPKVNRIVFRSQPPAAPEELPPDEKVASEEERDALRTLVALHIMKAADDFDALDTPEAKAAMDTTGMTKDAAIELTKTADMLEVLAPLMKNEQFRHWAQTQYLQKKHPLLYKWFGWLRKLPFVQDWLDKQTYARFNMQAPGAPQAAPPAAPANGGATGDWTGGVEGIGGLAALGGLVDGISGADSVSQQPPSIQFDPSMAAPEPRAELPSPAAANTAPAGVVSAPMADPSVPPPAPPPPVQPTGDFKWTPPGGSPTTMPSMFSAPTPPPPAPVKPVSPIALKKPTAPAAPMVPGAPQQPKYAGLLPFPTTAGIMNSTIGSLIAENVDKPDAASAAPPVDPKAVAAETELSAGDPQAQQFLAAKRQRIRELLTELAAGQSQAPASV